jgi:hypothetical protein
MIQSRSNIRSLGTDSNDALEKGKDIAKGQSQDQDKDRGIDVQATMESDAHLEAEAALALAAREAAAGRERRSLSEQRAAKAAMARQRAMEYTSHSLALGRAMAAVNESVPPSSQELEIMMQSFSDHQAASQDKCPALLLEIKHQLNVLVEHIHELAIEINVTEQTLTTEHHQIETTYEMINQTHLWKQVESQKCKEKKEEDYKLYWILKAELLEMHQIANPSYTANYDYSSWALKHDFSAKTHTIVSTSTGTATASATASATGSTYGTGHGSGYSGGTGYSGGYSGGGFSGGGFSGGYYGLDQTGAKLDHASPPQSLLETEQHEPVAEGKETAEANKDPASIRKSRALVQQTKKLAAELTACMASKPQAGKAADAPVAAFLEEAAGAAVQNGYAGFSGGGYSGQYSTSGYLGSGGQYSTTGQFTGYGGAYSGGGGYSTGGYSTGGGGYSTGGFSTGHGHGGYTGSTFGSASSTASASSSASSTGTVYHSSMHSSSHSTVKVSSHSSMSKYTTSTTGNWGESDECQYQKHALQVIYIRAYIEITRLLAEYEVLIHTTTCDDYVYETEGTEEKLLEGKIVKMTTTVSTYTHKLEAYKQRITSALKVQVHLKQEIKLLTIKCGEMDKTVSSLDKVRDAIQVMGVCPGLGRFVFSIPKYTGDMPSGSFDPVTDDDAITDRKLNELCTQTVQVQDHPIQGIKYHYRAAETSELMLRSIENLPTKNTAAVPLMGTCPNCEGDDDDPDGQPHASGHARVCWDPTKPLDATRKRTDCSQGRKAVLCVEEVALEEVLP